MFLSVGHEKNVIYSKLVNNPFNILYKAQLFNTNTVSPNTFCHNILLASTAIYSQSAENKEEFFLNFYQRIQISGKYRRNCQDENKGL